MQVWWQTSACNWELTVWYGYDFRNKRIAVIGGGSSSIQIVPELQKVPGAQLSVFVRHKTWITNRFGDYIMGQMGWDTGHLESESTPSIYSAMV